MHWSEQEHWQCDLCDRIVVCDGEYGAPDGWAIGVTLLDIPRSSSEWWTTKRDLCDCCARFVAQATVACTPPDKRSEKGAAFVPASFDILRWGPK